MSKHNSFQKENCQFSHWLHLQLLFKAYIQNEMSSSRSPYPIIVSSEPPQAVLITCAPLRPVASSVVTSSYLPPINPTYLPTLFMDFQPCRVSSSCVPGNVWWVRGHICGSGLTANVNIMVSRFTGY